MLGNKITKTNASPLLAVRRPERGAKAEDTECQSRASVQKVTSFTDKPKSLGANTTQKPYKLRPQSILTTFTSNELIIPLFLYKLDRLALLIADPSECNFTTWQNLAGPNKLSQLFNQ